MLGIVISLGLATPARASSHMDAPLIVLDPAANTTDVYAFRSNNNGKQYLAVRLAVYPFEEPGIGPNKYQISTIMCCTRFTLLLAPTWQRGKGQLLLGVSV